MIFFYVVGWEVCRSNLRPDFQTLPASRDTHLGLFNRAATFGMDCKLVAKRARRRRATVSSLSNTVQSERTDFLAEVSDILASRLGLRLGYSHHVHR